MNTKKLHTKISEKWIDENHILHIKYIDGAVIGLQAVMQSKLENEKLFDDKRELVLCDARASFTITPEAQKYARQEIINKSRVATAIVTNKGFVQLVVNFALLFTKIKSNVKTFSNEKEALKWLHSFQSN